MTSWTNDSSRTTDGWPSWLPESSSHFNSHNGSRTSSITLSISKNTTFVLERRHCFGRLSWGNVAWTKYLYIFDSMHIYRFQMPHLSGESLFVNSSRTTDHKLQGFSSRTGKSAFYGIGMLIRELLLEPVCELKSSWILNVRSGTDYLEFENIKC